MPSQPLVSIVTPSFNQAAYLEQTLRSVIDQDYPFIEYLVVDGGSDDGSVDVIRRYEDRLARWVSEPDRGQAHAINKGMASAQGEIVAWLNSDDIYLPHAVSEAVAALTTHPEVGMVYANGLHIDETGEMISWVRNRQQNLLDLLCFRIISQATVFLRRSLWQELGGLDLSLHFLLDHDLWMRAAAKTPILHQDRFWAGIRHHPQAKNTAHRAAFIQEAGTLIERARVHPEMAELYARHSQRICAGKARFASTYYAVNGDIGRGLGSYLEAVRLYPRTLRESWPQLFLLAAASTGLLKDRNTFLRLRRWRRRLMRKPDAAGWQTWVQ